MNNTCACMSRPWCSPIPTVGAIKFCVGGGSSPFDKCGTHGPTMALCGCDTGNHRDLGIEVDSVWFGALTTAQKHAVVAHEHGHTQEIACERCCDRHAGYLMRAWGYTKDGIANAFSFVQSRPTAASDAVEGANAFDAGVDQSDAAQASGGASGYDSSWQMTMTGIDLAAANVKGKTARALASSAPPRSLTVPTISANGGKVLATIVQGPAKGRPAPTAATGPGTTESGAPLTPPIVQIPVGNVGGRPLTTVPPPSNAPAPSGLMSAGGLDPGGPGSPGFTISTPTDGNPNLAGQLGATLSGTTIDPTIVRSEVLSGLLVAFLVFVVFRWGGK